MTTCIQKYRVKVELRDIYNPGYSIPSDIHWTVMVNGRERGTIHHAVASWNEHYFITVPELGISSNNFQYDTRERALEEFAKLYSEPGYYAKHYEQRYIAKKNVEEVADMLDRRIKQ